MKYRSYGFIKKNYSQRKEIERSVLHMINAVLEKITFEEFLKGKFSFYSYEDEEMPHTMCMKLDW